ncbi:MAG: rhodanese-related sulfurtransferase [Paracoccaceae bacterium]|jgi:rhodanese-related sulfurtransferase
MHPAPLHFIFGMYLLTATPRMEHIMLNLLRTKSQRPAGLTAADAVAQVSDGTLTLIDIRDPSEAAMTGRAKGAVAIPLVALRMQADPASPECHISLKTDQPIALYCASGARSGMAVQMMRQMGYENVTNLGGLHHWSAAGGEVV